MYWLPGDHEAPGHREAEIHDLQTKRHALREAPFYFNIHKPRSHTVGAVYRTGIGPLSCHVKKIVRRVASTAVSKWTFVINRAQYGIAVTMTILNMAL